MEALGEGAPHRQLIQDQIEERIRSLEEFKTDSECSSVTNSGFSTVRSIDSLNVKTAKLNSRAPSSTKTGNSCV